MEKLRRPGPRWTVWASFSKSELCRPPEAALPLEQNPHAPPRVVLSMKLFILGATGGIGQHLLQIALERIHQVTAYVRSPQKIGFAHERLKVDQGDLFNSDQMARS